MSDRMNDALTEINAETAKCICGRPVPESGPSLDYCSLDCQYGFFAGLDRVASGFENHTAKAIPDGRTINNQVSNWIEQSREARPDMNWASASTTLHNDIDRGPSAIEPRVELFPSPRPGEPVDIAAGVDLTPFITAMEITTRHPALLVGDNVTITDHDGHTTHSVVTSSNDDGSYILEPTEGNQQ